MIDCSVYKPRYPNCHLEIVFDSETLAMVSPSAAAFTDSSHEVLDLDKATKSDADPSAKSANGNACNTSGCVLAGTN